MSSFPPEPPKPKPGLPGQGYQPRSNGRPAGPPPPRGGSGLPSHPPPPPPVAQPAQPVSDQTSLLTWMGELSVADALLTEYLSHRDVNPQLDLVQARIRTVKDGLLRKVTNHQ